MTSSDLEPRLIIPHPSPIYDDKNLRNKLWHLHGSLLCVAYFLVFPAGVVAIRSGSRRALRYHYLLQMSGTVLAFTGIAVGFLISGGIGITHQYLGLAIGALFLVQPLLGWKHHIDFRRIKSRTWISYAHLWIGRIGMGVSWVNILLGIRRREYHFLVQAGAGVAMLLFVVSWMLWGLGVIDASHVAHSGRADEGDAGEGLMSSVGNEFALDDFDEQSEDEETEQLRSSRT